MEVPFFCTIPAYVLRDVETPANGKLLYAVISHKTHALGREAVCDSSNAELAEVFGWSERTVSRLLQQLERAGFLVIRDAQSERQILLNLSAPDGRSCDHGVDNIVYPGRQNCLPSDTSTDNVQGYINNNNKQDIQERKESKKEKKEAEALDDEALYRFVTDWIQSNGPDWYREDKRSLREAIMAFYGPREQKAKNPTRTKSAVTRMLNLTARKCHGNPVDMMEAIDNATAHGWRGVFVHDLTAAPAQASTEGSGSRWV